MAEAKAKARKPKEAQVEQPIEEVVEVELDNLPTEDMLKLEQLLNNNFILVQWIGSKGPNKLAPSPNGAVRQFGAPNYGLAIPDEYMMIHADDFHPRFYRRPDVDEKPDKRDVKLSISGRHGERIRVTW